MKNAYFLGIILGFYLISCNSEGDGQNQTVDISTSEIDSLDQKEETEQPEGTTTNFAESDLREVESLIRDVTAWHDLGNPYGPELILDSAKKFYTGIDLFVLDIAAEDLSSTDYFTDRFIKDYSDIYLAIDEKLRSGELIYEVGTYPPYGSGADPWCNCQDVPFDEPIPWSLIEVETINTTENSGEFEWKWGGIEANTGSGWNSFRYRFKVKKIDGKWKIDYLEGFNMHDFIRTNF